MAYTKQNFTQGQVLTAPHLNHIENGIAQNDVAITELKPIVESNQKNIVQNKAELEKKLSNTNNHIGSHAMRLDIAERDLASALSDIESLQQSVNTFVKTTDDKMANAIKGVVSGTQIALKDVSPIEHDALVSVDVVGDSAPSKILVSGKNLIQVGTLTVANHQVVNLPIPLPPGTYTLSANVESTDIDQDLSSVSIQGTKGELMFKPMRRGGSSTVITVTEPITKLDFCAAYNYSEGVDDVATWHDVQLEIGNVASTFEEHRGIVEYNMSNANSVLVTSNSPNMSILSDTGDATLLVTYNRDTTAVINDLLARISALEKT